MTATKLTHPALAYRQSFVAALREFQAEGLYTFVDSAQVAKDFEGFIERLHAGERPLHHPAPDWLEVMPETALWFVKDEDYIGHVHIRHRLNWHLERWGGHINFIIRPSWRGKGFGKKILLKALPAAADLGVERALMTVRPNNARAIHVIVSCGGVFEDETEATQRFPARRHYWIDCER